ncbi:MAG TPA: hypothetical protein QGF58_05995 [Myxococcota bacterium]|nr:hypothetical protein [Myxococcota bacterium]
MLALLSAAAAATVAESETVVQVRHDFLGQRQLPASEYLRVRSEHHGVAVSGYAGLSWSGEIDPDLYLLNASSQATWGSWEVGRQLVRGPLRPMSLDGAQLSWTRGGLQFSGWGGLARHHDLDDLADGEAMARLEARVVKGPARLRLGGLAGVESSPHADGELWLGGDRAGVRALVVTGPEAPVQWARVALESSLTPGVRASIHAQHREALDPDSLFGEAITAAFAPEGVDQVGGSVRLRGARRSTLWTSYALTSHSEDEVRQWGHLVDVAWLPGRARLWTVAPAYAFRSGPGGVFHALSARATLSLSDARSLHATAAVVPYRKLHEPWDTVLTGGLEVHSELTERLRVQAGVEAASDATHRFDLRGNAGLVVSLP